MAAAAAPPARLELEEAVLLGYTFAVRVASDLDIRLLAVKGPTLAALGLRDPSRLSVDVDVVVDPDHLVALLESLERHGWCPRPSGTHGRVLPSHSVTLSNARWPVEIDVHHYFPGMTIPARDAFEVLWADRVYVRLAGRAVPCPSRCASALIAVLHEARDGRERSRATSDIAWLETALTVHERSHVADLALQVGAVAALLPYADRLDVNVDPGAVDPRDLAMWNLQRVAQSASAVGWMVTLRAAPWRQRPRLLWRAVWLSEEELRSRYPAARRGRVGHATMILDRWWHALRALPRARRLLRDHRRDSR